MTTMADLSEERAMAEASAWLARLQSSEVDEADGMAFDAWISQTPRNRDAYRRTLAVWQTFEAGAAEVRAELDHPRPKALPRRAPSRRWMVGAGGFALAAGLALALTPPMLLQPQTETYVTGTGERRQVALADGSTIDLNAQTRLSVRLSRAERRVVMAEGEAIFDVAADADRPFLVETSNRMVRVVGTQFDVKSRAGQLTVTVARGKVQVGPLDGAASGRAVLLTPGQRLAVDRSGAEALRGVDPEEALSWRAGRMVYRGETLAEVVADLNRQFPRPIEIGDPELAQIPITGVIVMDDQDAVMTRLSLMLPLRSVGSDRGLLLLKK